MRHLFVAVLLSVAACSSGPADEPRRFDVVLRGGTVYDGSGAAPFVADVALDGDLVVAVGDLSKARGGQDIDAHGLAVAPGFINVLSWANESVIADPRALSDVTQGVTLEVFGEGDSMGPLTDAMAANMVAEQGDLKFDVSWRTLGEYLHQLESSGVGVNVASFVGAATLRIHEIGYEDRPATPEELRAMQDLAREAMREGALGLGSSLIYAPGFYADTAELVALAEAVGESGGIYISHLRSEGNRFLEALEELIHIARAAEVAAEVYHLKAAGQENWPKLAQAIARIEEVRAEGLRVTADVYTYTAGATGLDAAMPPWVQAGGLDRWRSRLTDPEIRARLIPEMSTPTDEWENLYLAAGGGEGVLLVGFKSPELKPLTGKTLAEVAAQRGTSCEETAMDLVIEDGSRVGCVYTLMSDDNLRTKLRQPWVSICSDSAAPAPEGAFLLSSTHPRAYGSFARLLAKFVRDEGVLTLADAIRRMTSLPAGNLQLEGRGRLEPGAFADVVVFDPTAIQDHATYDDPHRLATGVQHVFVNGVQVLRAGEHTGALPGRFVKGPGSPVSR